MTSLIKIYSPPNEFNKIIITFPWSGGNINYYRSWKSTCMIKGYALYGISLPWNRGMKELPTSISSCNKKKSVTVAHERKSCWQSQVNTMQSIAQEVIDLLIRESLLIPYLVSSSTPDSTTHTKNIVYAPVTSMVLFGHSFGALLAYEVCKRINYNQILSNAVYCQPGDVGTKESLVDVNDNSCWNTSEMPSFKRTSSVMLPMRIELHVSGMFDPYTVSLFNHKREQTVNVQQGELSLPATSKKWSLQSDEEFYQYLQTLGGIPDNMDKQTYIECFLPSIRYDYALYENYHHRLDSDVWSNLSCLPDQKLFHSPLDTVYSLHTYVGVNDTMIFQYGYDMSCWNNISSDMWGRHGEEMSFLSYQHVRIGNKMKYMDKAFECVKEAAVPQSTGTHEIHTVFEKNHTNLAADEMSTSKCDLKHNHFYMCNEPDSHQQLMDMVLH